MAMAVAFADRAAGAGWSPRRIAGRLELPVATLARWREARDTRAVGLHEVVLGADPLDRDREERSGRPGDVALVTPDGFRIEGLAVAAVPGLVAALRR